MSVFTVTNKQVKTYKEGQTHYLFTRTYAKKRHLSKKSQICVEDNQGKCRYSVTHNYKNIS